MLRRVAHRIGRALEVLIVLALAIMGILVFGNVVLRYAFSSGIAMSEELSRLLFVWLIFVGAILASAQHAHIGFDSLSARLSVAHKRILIAIIGVLMLVASVIFIVGGWHQTVINLDNSYPVLGISYAWLYAVAIVFGVAMLFVVSYNVWNALTGSGGKGELEMTQDLADRIEEKITDVSVDGSGRDGRSAR